MAEWTDDELLTALRLRDEGLKPTAIGRHLGRSRYSVRAKLADVDRDLEASEDAA